MKYAVCRRVNYLDDGDGWDDWELSFIHGREWLADLHVSTGRAVARLIARFPHSARLLLEYKVIPW